MATIARSLPSSIVRKKLMTKVIVSMSGGKDSTATALLAVEREVNPMLAFSDTGHEHPSTYEYVDYLESKLDIKIERCKADFTRDIERKREVVQTKWRKDGISEDKIERALAVLHPTGNPFLDMCLWKGRFPSTMARFCTEQLKILPFNEQVLFPAINKYGQVETWVGVRADESRARANLPERSMDDTGAEIVRPILHWTVEDVFAMHKKHGIDPNPLYKQGMGRVGCMPCISCNKEELRQIAMRFPEEIERVSEWEAIVKEASKQDGATFFTVRANEMNELTTREEHEKLASIKGKVDWANTTKGKVQYDLISVYEEPSMCHSIYGLCE
jgi:3'-phosphoadenosine 5'-phosphosulfate sulfotransferase (PAPS reductase)/FAD synthetase